MPATRTFLVEAYAPASSELGRIAEQARLTVSAAGAPSSLRHIRSILVPSDELCLHLFEADSADVLVAAVASASMTAPRVVEVSLLTAEEAGS